MKLTEMNRKQPVSNRNYEQQNTIENIRALHAHTNFKHQRAFGSICLQNIVEHIYLSALHRL